MEECEALCSDFGILSKGQFQCLGTSQHVKNKYSKGIYFSIKKRSPQLNSNEIEEFIFRNVPNSYVQGKQNETLFFHTMCRYLSIADLFSLLEKNSEKLLIESFSISETTLEQIFVTLNNNEKNDLISRI